MTASPPPTPQPEVITTITLPGGIPCTILRGHNPELARRQREYMADLVKATEGQK